MAVLQIIDEWKSFRSKFQESKPSDIRRHHAKDEINVNRTWVVNFKGKSVIHATLSPQHSIEFQAG